MRIGLLDQLRLVGIVRLKDQGKGPFKRRYGLPSDGQAEHRLQGLDLLL